MPLSMSFQLLIAIEQKYRISIIELIILISHHKLLFVNFRSKKNSDNRFKFYHRNHSYLNKHKFKKAKPDTSFL